MKIASFFSGIGGLDLGCEMVGGQTVVYSEHDPKIAKKKGRQYAAEVMAKHWPDAPNVGDISDLIFATNSRGEQGILRHAEEGVDVLFKGEVDWVVGGFPCQDISAAGKQAGLKEGTRSGLWRHMFQAIKGLRPKGVIIENVAALAGKGLDVVVRDLASVGYDCEWDVIAAAGVGAPHLRERLFVIAWPRGTGEHGEWPEPPVFEQWAHEPEDAPRLVTEPVADRPAKLRCLGNAVVPQVAAHVAKLLSQRLLSGMASPHIREQLVATEDAHDVKIKRGEMKGKSKRIGWAITPTNQIYNANIPPKLPRSGRMTDGILYERERSCPQAHAKKTGLAYMAPTLRPRADDHPELPHTGLVPTPNASVANDGEGAETWVERKVKHATKAENPTRASMPLAIYAQLKPKLVPTPTAKDADSSRSRSAIRTTPPERESQMGETLTDFVDPTNGGRLLPSPAAADGDRASDTYMRGNPTLQGATRLLPTPSSSDPDGSRTLPPGTSPTGIAPDGKKYQVGLEHAAKLLPTPKATDGDKGVRTLEGARNEMARGKGGDLDSAVKLLPNPTVQDGDNDGGPSQFERNSLPLNAAVKLLPTPTVSMQTEQDMVQAMYAGDDPERPAYADATFAKLLPTPRACSGLRSSGMNRTEMMDALDDTVGALLPTPRASENENRQTKPTPSQLAGTHGRSLVAEMHVREGVAAKGKLAPRWVCWLMGLPLDWLDL